jgi:integral membrane protein (TIGR01906 family)
MLPAISLRPTSILIAIATAIVIVAVGVLPFLTPAWLSFAQGRADAAAWTGYTAPDLRTATDALVHDLVIGPPAFDVVVAGAPVLTEAERSHLRDVRGVFGGLAVLTLAALVVLAIAFVRWRSRPSTWRAVRGGSFGLIAAVAVLGAVAALAFDAAFELFHRLLFTGNYSFDPRTDRLVQLFPDQLWFETTIAVGIVIVVLALLVGWWAGRRATALSGRSSAAQAEADVARTELHGAHP